MNIAWKQHKEYIVTISIIVCGVLLVWFGILPMRERIRNRMNRVQELIVDREIRNESVSIISELRDHRDIVSREGGRLNIVISKGAIVDLVKIVEGIAKETDNAITISTKDQSIIPVVPVRTKKDSVSVKTGDAASETLAGSLPSDHGIGISIELTGNYSSIVRFIQRLESMPYATDIVALSLSVQRENLLSVQSRSSLFAQVAIPDSGATRAAAGKGAAVSNETLPLKAVLDTVVYIRED